MPALKINDILMKIPDSVVTTETLLRMGRADAGDVSYLIDENGNQTVLTPGQQVEVKDGARFGTVSRFRTGGTVEEKLDLPGRKISSSRWFKYAGA